MLKRSRTKWPLAKKLRAIFLAAFLMLCLLPAAGINNDANMKLRLIGIHDNCLVMLLENSGRIHVYYKDISSSDSTLTEAENIPDSGYAFFLDGGTLGIAESFEDELDVGLYPFDTNLELDEYCNFSFVPSKGDKLVFVKVEHNIYNMYILSSERNMRLCEAMLEPEDEILLSDVSFLNSTQGGWVYAYADGVLRRWSGSGFKSSEEYRNIPCPQKLIGEDVYIDETGLLVRIRDGFPEIVDLNIGSIDSCACFGADDYVIAADDSGIVHKFDWSGEDIVESGTVTVEGKIYGIVEDYVLVQRDGQLYLEELVFSSPDDGPGEQEDPTPTWTPAPTPDPEEIEEPTPSPTPDNGTEGTPSPEPEPTSTPDPDEGNSEPGEATPTPSPTGGNDEVGKLIEEIGFKELTGENGKYVAMISGARVADLRKIYWPQSIEAFTQDNSPVFESTLKTGMKIHISSSDDKSEEISVIIRGDCDGDGKVRKSDITFASLYIVNAAYAETEVQFMAMDMNDDGEVNIWDLPMIADETRRKE